MDFELTSDYEHTEEFDYENNLDFVQMITQIRFFKIFKIFQTLLNLLNFLSKSSSGSERNFREILKSSFLKAIGKSNYLLLDRLLETLAVSVSLSFDFSLYEEGFRLVYELRSGWFAENKLRISI